MDILEVDENGSLTLPAEVIGGAKPHTRFRVERSGDELTLSREPVEPTRDRSGPDEWWVKWRDLVEAISEQSTSEVSAVDILSEMRR